MGDVNTDRRYLTEQQYATDGNLAARQSIYAFQRPVVDFWGGSLDLAELSGDETILDVGCGNGRYLGALQGRRHRGLVCGADLSIGMLHSAQSAAGDDPLLVGDAQALPFADAAFDAVLAMHMLYHVPDRAVAIAELRRVLRPGGVALVVTNSESHLRELDDLLEECARTAAGIERLPVRGGAAFKMEGGGTELEAAFTSVTPHMFASELVLTEAEPAVNYARSMGAWVADTEGELDSVIPELERRMRQRIEADGAFRVRTAAGCFVCR